MKPRLEFLEIMVINACNLACEGCTTFSDLKHSGYVKWQQAREWLSPWLSRVDLDGVGFMGGEPLMNPNIHEWIRGFRDLMPATQIRFVTNGLLLDRHWDVIESLDQVGNAVLKISQHVDTPELLATIERVFAWTHWTPINEFGIDRWVSPSGLRFQVTRPQRFFKTFKNDYADMAPHDNDPKRAFDLCVQKKCPLLYQGNLFKCGTLALTPPLLARMGWPNRELWQDYVTHGLAPDCSDQELLAFLENFGKPHRLCRQCPTIDDASSILDHTKTVKFK